MFPENTVLGKLELIEVYSYYDAPALFACHNEEDNIYVAILVDVLEDRQIWLYAPISVTCLIVLTDLSTKEWDCTLREVFTDAEEGYVWKVSIYKAGNSDVEKMLCTEIPEDYLPQ